MCATCDVFLASISGFTGATATSSGAIAAVQAARSNGGTWWQIWAKIQKVLQEMQAADRTLVSLEDMYYMIQAFKYLHDNGGVLGALNYMSTATSMVSGLASEGLSAYQDTTSSFAPAYAMSPQDYEGVLSDLALVSSTSGALAQSAQTLSMISNENSGVPFLEVVNGAQLGVQAAITTTQAVDNLAQFMAQRQQQKAMNAQAARVEAEQKYLSGMPQVYTVPCDNMAATVTIISTDTQLASNGTSCSTYGAPGANYVTSTGTGINQAIANANQQQCIQSVSSIVMSGGAPPNCSPSIPITQWNAPNPGLGGGGSYGVQGPTFNLTNSAASFFSSGGAP